MNYLRYDPQTGAIRNYGYMNDLLVQAEIDAGKPTLFCTELGDVTNWRVNLQTKELERIAPDVIPPNLFPDL